MLLNGLIFYLYFAKKKKRMFSMISALAFIFTCAYKKKITSSLSLIL